MNIENILSLFRDKDYVYEEYIEYSPSEMGGAIFFSKKIKKSIEIYFDYFYNENRIILFNDYVEYIEKCEAFLISEKIKVFLLNSPEFRIKKVVNQIDITIKNPMEIKKETKFKDLLNSSWKKDWFHIFFPILGLHTFIDCVIIEISLVLMILIIMGKISILFFYICAFVYICSTIVSFILFFRKVKKTYVYINKEFTYFKKTSY